MKQTHLQVYCLRIPSNYSGPIISQKIKTIHLEEACTKFCIMLPVMEFTNKFANYLCLISSSDPNQFGRKLMERMGWSDGKGLGMNEDGKKDCVKVSLKANTKGE